MSLHILPPAQYPGIRHLIAPDSCGAVYPLSVIGGSQSGVIFTDDSEQAMLIWHCCGFAFLYGNYDRAFLAECAEMMRHPVQYARMLLFAPDAETAAFFRENQGFALEQRLFFRYPAEKMPPQTTHPTVKITPDILPLMQGRITPAFSWDAPADFFAKGCGYCVMQDGMPAAWAFSAAVSEQETDIGAETHEQYRRRGFAFAAAAAMIQDTLSQGKTPVWACHAQNLGSQKLAAVLGFLPCGECLTVKRTE